MSSLKLKYEGDMPVKDVSNSQDFGETFEHAELRQLHEQSWIGAGLMLILIPVGISLDYFVYADVWIQFIGYRLAADFVVLATIFLHATTFGRSRPDILVAMWLGVAIVMICLMIYVTIGSQSTYYAGLALALLAVGILLPLRFDQALAICVSTLTLYAAACIGPGSPPIHTADLFNNLYFLLLAGVICLTAVHFNARRRYDQYVLQTELEARNRQLAELDRMKSDFFANVSHELRTPLTLILAPVQDLLRRVEAHSSELRNPLQMINTSALRLLRLVNDLLDLLRFEHGNTELNCTKVDLTTLLSGLVDEVRHLAGQQGLSLELQLPVDRILVYADEAALERIFLNLLSNAIKFTDAGGCVKVQGRIEGANVRIDVNDTGVGITELDQAKIFDRFQQGDQSSTRRRQGLGLGLALVKELAKQLGGDVFVDSGFGVGTTMSIQLPIYSGLETSVDETRLDGQAPSEFHREASWEGTFVLPAVTTEVVAVGEAPAVKSRQTVLIADDDTNMQRYLKHIVSREFEVRQAYDGETTLEMAMNSNPDLIILDLMLPGKDGIEVCRALKAHLQHGRTKIILLTARVDEEAKIAALRNGADDFVTKPFNSIELVTRLKNLARSAALEQEVYDRNCELETTLRQLGETEAQLVHSERLNALGTMAAGLLHEINNPINYIGIALKVGIKKVEKIGDEDLQEILTDVYDGYKRIGAIISDLRAFATPQSPQSRKSFRVGTAVQHALRFTASETTLLDLTTDIAEDHVAVGNEQLIIQVLVNLVLNAARAVRKQEFQDLGQIRIWSQPQGQRLEVFVRDNGCGIPKAQIPHIFDPFFTTQDVGAGMGMGLAISHGIVKSHGGKLTVKSEAEEYTEFRFDLPQAKKSNEKGRSYATIT